MHSNFNDLFESVANLKQQNDQKIQINVLNIEKQLNIIKNDQYDIKSKNDAINNEKSEISKSLLDEIEYKQDISNNLCILFNDIFKNIESFQSKQKIQNNNKIRDKDKMKLDSMILLRDSKNMFKKHKYQDSNVNQISKDQSKNNKSLVFRSESNNIYSNKSSKVKKDYISNINSENEQIDILKPIEYSKNLILNPDDVIFDPNKVQIDINSAEEEFNVDNNDLSDQLDFNQNNKIEKVDINNIKNIINQRNSKIYLNNDTRNMNTEISVKSEITNNDICNQKHDKIYPIAHLSEDIIMNDISFDNEESKIDENKDIQNEDDQKHSTNTSVLHSKKNSVYYEKSYNLEENQDTNQQSKKNSLLRQKEFQEELFNELDNFIDKESNQLSNGILKQEKSPLINGNLNNKNQNDNYTHNKEAKEQIDPPKHSTIKKVFTFTNNFSMDKSNDLNKIQKNSNASEISNKNQLVHEEKVIEESVYEDNEDQEDLNDRKDITEDDSINDVRNSECQMTNGFFINAHFHHSEDPHSHASHHDSHASHHDSHASNLQTNELKPCNKIMNAESLKLNLKTNSDFANNNEKSNKQSKSDFNSSIISLSNQTKRMSNDINKSQTVRIQKIQRYKSEIIDELFQQDPERLQELKELLNSSEIGAIVVDKDEKILQTNNLVTEKLLQNQKKLLDLEMLSLIPHSDQLALRARIEESKNALNHNISNPFLIRFQDSNLTTVEFQCTLAFHTIADHHIKIFWISSPIQEVSQVIEHKSYIYLTWLGFIALLLIFLLLQMPQDMAFKDSQTLDAMELQLTIIFGVDIVVNFNLTQEGEEDCVVADRQLIVKNQVSSWFLIDFISTVPTDLIFKYISTQLLKSLKIIRILRFFKLMKLLRLTKIYSILRMISEGDMKRIYNFLKQNQGQLDLLKNMGYIYLFAHFWTIGFWVLEKELCTGDSICWKNQQEAELRESMVGNQNFILQEHIKVALGLGAITMQNNWEVQMSIVWMFIGLSLFGYGIGNISSQLNQANKQDLEYMETMNYFNELCIMNNIDPRLQNIVISNLEQNFSKYMDRELHHYASSLSTHVFDQLELSLLEKFVSSFKLFEKLNVKVLRLIKRDMLLDCQKVLLRKGTSFKSVQMVQEGSINIQDGGMHMINYFEKGEIQGLSEFFNYFNHKYEVNVEKIIQDYIDQHDNRVKRMVNQSILNKIAGKLATLNSKLNTPSKSTPDDTRSLLKVLIDSFDKQNLEFKQTISINDDYLTYNYNAICSDDSNQISVPFSVLEEVLFTDVDSFQQIQKYDMQQNREINDDEVIESDEFVTEFRNSDTPALMVYNSSEVQDLNAAFIENQNLSGEDEIIGTNILELLTSDSKSMKFSDYVDSARQNLNMYDYNFNVIIKVQGPNKIIKYKNSNSLNLHKYAKSLFSATIIQLFDCN